MSNLASYQVFEKAPKAPKAPPIINPINQAINFIILGLED
jgi:hypothetical protein